MTVSGTRELRPLIGAALGVAIALMDLALLRVVGVQMQLAGRDVTLPVLLLFGATFAALGYVNGKLLVARARARRDAATIERQLQALERSQARMLQAEKLASIGRMAASVAHEVRNPLGVIGSSASLLEETLADDDADGRTAARFIAEEVERLDGFVRSLLDFSRPLQRRSGDASLREVAERVQLLGRERAREHGATVEMDIEAGLKAARSDEHGRIDLDDELFTRALVVLVDNACQAAERVQLQLRQTADGSVEAAVRDDGPGVAEAIRERLFEPFVTTRARGTGLGLAMAARIAEALGANLALVDGDGLGPGGRGACFALRVPAQPLPQPLSQPLPQPLSGAA